MNRPGGQMRFGRHSAAVVIATACGALALPRLAAAAQSNSPPLLAGGTIEHRGGPLYFDYELLAFGASGAQTEAILSVSVDGSRLTPSVGSHGWGYGAVAVLQLGRGGRREAIATALATLSCTGRLGPSHGVPLYLSVRLEPGLYDFALTVSDPHRERGNPTSRSAGRLIVPDLDGPGPVLTTLAIATDSVAEPWNGAPGGLQLNPTHLVTAGAPPLIYFEVHGVRPGASVRTDVTLEPFDASGPLDALLRGRRRAYTIRYHDRAPVDPRQPIRSTLRLEPSGLRTGPYSIRIVAEEEDGGLASLPMTSELRVIDGVRSGYSTVRCEDAPRILEGPHESPTRRLDGDTASR